MKLIIEQLSKSYGPVRALRSVSFEVASGEIHAVCGENGAGKSTLMKILGGHLSPDSGQVWLQAEGASRLAAGPEDLTAKIALVHQEGSLFDHLSVAENIFVNDPPRGPLGTISRPGLLKASLALLKRVGLANLSPDTKVGELSTAQKGLVEIAKALAQNPSILILDEPTASLGEPEVDRLMQVLSEEKLAGTTLLYISHRMPEIFRISDRITVLKDGKFQGTFQTNISRPAAITLAMIGRELAPLVAPSHQPGDELLRLERLSGLGFEDISLSIRTGEIIGFAGLVGAGRTELAQTIYGHLPLNSGSMFLDGKRYQPQHPADALRAGIAYLTEDRKRDGLFLDQSVRRNVLATRSELIREKATASTQAVEALRKRLKIVTPNLDHPARQLSGGNQQKVLLARYLAATPRMLIVDEPTRGVDVGAKFEIYRLLFDLAAAGTTILLVSSELPELLTLSDRIFVLREGHLSGSLSRERADEISILTLAS